MSTFSADWLTLREPADARSRSADLVRSVANALPPDRRIRALDLGAGTGSNVRYLAPLLPESVDWCLVDRDPALLAAASSRVSAGVTMQLANLADLVAHDALFADRQLVTASALLDLVSEHWLETLITFCRSASASVLFALSYDGRITCHPGDSDDGLVRELVNAHQAGDKGFGPALGPKSVSVLARLLSAAGYRVLREQSDWRLGRDDRELQRQLILGWGEAAAEMAPEHERRIAEWTARRTALVAAGRSEIVVGHEDLAGLS